MTSAAIGIIFNSERDKILILQRRDVNVWVLPGGGVDPSETPEEATIREVFEETGLTVAIKRKVAEYTPVNKLTKSTHVFECTVISGNISTGPETRDINFFSIKNLPSNFFPLHKTWMLDALKNDPHVITRPLSEITYFTLLTYFCSHPISIVRLILSRMGFPINSK